MNHPASDAAATTLDDAPTRPTKLLDYRDGVYHTPAGVSSWFGRTFPSLAFYTRFAWIVLRSSHMAKRGRYGYREWADSSVDVLRALEKVGINCEITGIEHLRKVEGPCLICGNHASTLETVVLPGIVQAVRDVTFVVKRGLVEYPVFKHVMKSRDPIVVSQINPREDLKAMLAGGAERLKQGVSIIVFPQGARAERYDPEKFNTIGVKLAHRAGVPIVPLALRSDAWANGKLLTELGKINPSRPVRFAFGEPLYIQGRGVEEQEALKQFISAKLREWNAPM